MDIEEARRAHNDLVTGPDSSTYSFGHERWVDAFAGADDQTRSRMQQIAWTFVHDGTPEERAYALGFWGAIQIPDGTSDALGELYLSAAPGSMPDVGRFLGGYAMHSFSDDVGRRLAARFAGDPEGERELATNVVRFDAQGAAWDALMRLLLTTDDRPRLYDLFGAADQAGRADDFFYAMRNKPQAIQEDFLKVVPLMKKQRYAQITGVRFP